MKRDPRAANARTREGRREGMHWQKALQVGGIAENMKILPDLLKPGLDVVFCGTAAGDASAARKAYYAGRGNRFWPTLFAIGLTPRQLSPDEFPKLLEFGIGLTDLVKHKHGADSTLRSADFLSVDKRIREHSPRVLAFNGKRAAQEFCRTKSVAYGRRPELFGSTTVFILPSTSGASNHCWSITPWEQLAHFVRDPHCTVQVGLR